MRNFYLKHFELNLLIKHKACALSQLGKINKKTTLTSGKTEVSPAKPFAKVSSDVTTGAAYTKYVLILHTLIKN